MKPRTSVATLYLGVFFCFFLICESTPSAAELSRPAEEGTESCMHCHTKPPELIPKSHPPVWETGLPDCLKCHGKADKLTAFAARIHLLHYCVPRFPVDCRSCHRISESGQFGLIGSGKPGEARISPDFATKMESYFRSWGASSLLDHRHAEKGLSCTSCHETTLPEKGVQKGQCLRCHGSYDLLSTKSPIHARLIAPHFDGGDDCGRCHRAHRKSELMCISCHEEMDLKVP